MYVYIYMIDIDKNLCYKNKFLLIHYQIYRWNKNVFVCPAFLLQPMGTTITQRQRQSYKTINLYFSIIG
jgi:hypothetical protein